MVKTVEEIAREQNVGLQRKAGKPSNGLIERYRPNILLQTRFWSNNRMVCSVANIWS